MRVPFGSEYTIRIKNKGHIRALADITIDGTDVQQAGTKVVVPAYGHVDIERFIDLSAEGRKFKFISIEQGTASGEIQDPTSADNGKIRVQIYPEKQVEPTFQGQQVNCTRSRKISAAGGQSVGDWSAQSATHLADPVAMSGAGASPASVAHSDRGIFHCADSSTNSLQSEGFILGEWLGRETLERRLPEAEKGATVEGGVSSQRFAIDRSYWSVWETPLVFEFQICGPKQPKVEPKAGLQIVFKNGHHQVWLNGQRLNDVTNCTLSDGRVSVQTSHGLHIQTGDYKVVYE